MFTLTSQLIEAFDQSGSSPPQAGGDHRLIIPAFEPRSGYTPPPSAVHPAPSTVVVGNLRWEVSQSPSAGRVLLASPSELVVPVCLVPCDVERVFANGESTPFIQVQEAARLAGVHEETIRRAYRNNQLPAQRVGVRGIRIHPTELKDWVANGMPTRPKNHRYGQSRRKGGSQNAGQEAVQ